MFRKEVWAGVFVSSLGANADAGLLCLKALVPPLKANPRVLSGHSMAMRIEKDLREAFTAAGYAKKAFAEFVIRFTATLIEKGRFRHIDSVTGKISEMLDAQKGILEVILESPAVLDKAQLEEFKKGIAKKTGAAEVRIKTQENPELLGGYRIQVGGFFIDASLKKQLENLKTDLETATLVFSNQMPVSAEGTQNG